MIENRRHFLRAAGRGAVAVAAAHAVPFRFASAQQKHLPLTVSDLRDGLHRISGAGCNVVALPTADGLAVVDSGSPDRADELAALIGDRFGRSQADLLLNTHWHLEHTGANEALARAGTRVIAHENTRLWMGTKVYVEWQDRRYSPRPAAALPNETFFSSDPQPIELTLGGERIVYGHLPEAHTDGDIYVWFADRNVIVAGGTVTVGTYPVMDYITGGWIGGLADATKTLIDMSDGETLIVPAGGPPRGRDDLVAQHEMLLAMRERIEVMANEGQGIDDMIAARISQDFDARFGDDAELFIANTYHGLWWGRRLRGAVA